MNANFRLNVIFEDDVLLVLNKPAGLPTQGTLDPKRDHLYAMAKRYLSDSYLALHHRLDVQTSGVIVMCKKKSANKALAEQFSGRTINKVYECLSKGSWPLAPPDSAPGFAPAKPTDPAPGFAPEIRVENHLKIAGKHPRRRAVATSSGGDLAITRFVLLESWNHKYCHIRALPQTGRMHQIRCHLAGLGLSIFGDTLYDFVWDDLDRKFLGQQGRGRVFLHASGLELKHPTKNTTMNFAAPLPADFSTLLNRLRSEDV